MTAPPSDPSQIWAGRDMGMSSSGTHLPDHTAQHESHTIFTELQLPGVMPFSLASVIQVSPL